jgi:hypothetical protein
VTQPNEVPTEGVTPTSQEAPAAAEPSPPATQGAEQTLTPQELDKRERDLKAQFGRERTVLQKQISELRGELANVHRTLNAQQEMALQERLSKMSPMERLQEELNTLKGQLRQPSPPAHASNQDDETDEEYTLRVASNTLTSINRMFGLSGESALTLSGVKDHLNWDTPESFAESARQLALRRVRGESTVTEKKAPQPAAQPAAPTESNIEEIVQKTVKGMFEQMGVSGSLSARPAGSANIIPTSDDVREAAKLYDPRNPQASRQRLQEIRDEAARKVQTVRTRK